MEFETDQPTDEEQRRLAEVKKVTLQPLHADITPDPLPDAEIGARKTVETAPNASNDTEGADRLMQPSKSALTKPAQEEPTPREHLRPSALALLIAVLAAIGATAWLWMQAA